jgi:hypothetical protein
LDLEQTKLSSLCRLLVEIIATSRELPQGIITSFDFVLVLAFSYNRTSIITFPPSNAHRYDKLGDFNIFGVKILSDYSLSSPDKAISSSTACTLPCTPQGESRGHEQPSDSQQAVDKDQANVLIPTFSECARDPADHKKLQALQTEKVWLENALAERLQVRYSYC